MTDYKSEIEWIKREIARYTAYCELDANLDETIDDEALAFNLSRGASKEELVKEFVTLQSEHLVALVTRPLFGRGSRAEHRRKSFLFGDAARFAMSAHIPEFCTYVDMLDADEQAYFAAIRSREPRTPLTSCLWFNLITLFIPKLFVTLRKLARPTDESVIASEMFVQWLRLALCAEGVAVPTEYVTCAATVDAAFGKEEQDGEITENTEKECEE